MNKEDYSLHTLEKDLIEELEDNKEEILESNGEYLNEYVDGSISVYTYDQIMIYANNSDLWYMESTLGGTTIQQQIVEVIFEHLSGVAHQWLREQQELLKEEA
jgi:methyltransferase-like protein